MSQVEIQCSKCTKTIGEEVITIAPLVRYHLDCFRCEVFFLYALKIKQVCQVSLADKFFSLEEDNKTHIFCEFDYFKKLDLICAKCGKGLDGKHIDALGKKYHLDHFTCSVCPLVFKQFDKYFEIDQQVYCQKHYSLLYANKCGGCQTAILKDFIEVNRDNVVDQWHPECFMLFKTWSVKIASSKYSTPIITAVNISLITQEIEEQRSNPVYTIEKVEKISRVLLAFEESAAECIGEMLIHFSTQNYELGVIQAERFVSHIEALFCGIDLIEIQLNAFTDSIGPSLVKDPKHLAKKIVQFFTKLTQRHEGPLKAKFTTELINLVTSLARELKSLIRLALKGSLKLDRAYNQNSSIHDLLAILLAWGETKASKNFSSGLVYSKKESLETDGHLCSKCKKDVEEANVQFGNLHWHKYCFVCSVCEKDLFDDEFLHTAKLELGVICCSSHGTPDGICGFEKVTQLNQYVLLLRCQLKRMCIFLKVEVSEKLSNSFRKQTEQNQNELTPPQSKHTSQSSTQPQILLSTSPQQQPPILKQKQTSAIGAIAPRSASLFAENSMTSTPVLSEKLGSSLERNQKGLSSNFLHSSNISMYPETSLKINKSSATIGDRALYLSELGPVEQLVVQKFSAYRLHSLMEAHISLEELMDLVETRKKGVFEKMAFAFKPSQKKNTKGTFGVPLEVLIERSGIYTDLGPPGTTSVRIPLFIDVCIRLLQKLDMSVEGIFRKNGNIKRLKVVTEDLDRDPHVFDFKDDNEIQIAALIKKFLRELPDPLLTFRLHKLFIISQKLSDQAKQKEAIHYLYCLLPKPNLDLLCTLLWFLLDVSKFSTTSVPTSGGGSTNMAVPANPTTSAEYLDEANAATAPASGGNKMDLENLAMVMAPNILYSKSKNVLDDESFLGISTISLLLKHQLDFLLVPEDLMASLSDVLIENTGKDKELIQKYSNVVEKMSSTNLTDVQTVTLPKIDNIIKKDR